MCQVAGCSCVSEETPLLHGLPGIASFGIGWTPRVGSALEMLREAGSSFAGAGVCCGCKPYGWGGGGNSRRSTCHTLTPNCLELMHFSWKKKRSFLPCDVKDDWMLIMFDWRCIPFVVDPDVFKWGIFLTAPSSLSANEVVYKTSLAIAYDNVLEAFSFSIRKYFKLLKHLKLLFRHQFSAAGGSHWQHWESDQSQWGLISIKIVNAPFAIVRYCIQEHYFTVEV